MIELELELEFDEESFEVLWKLKNRRFTCLHYLKILRALYESRPHPVAMRKLLEIAGYSAPTSLHHALSNMRKILGSSFPYEIKNEHKVGYVLVARKEKVGER